jgi:predicted amidohydrolase YtcJ
MGRVLLAGATVWAGPACVPSRAWMLVEDGRVAALAEQEPLPPADRVVDLPGCHLLPGFVDVHLHLSQAAWIPRGGDGWGWRGLAEALRAVRTAGNASPQAPWLLFWNVARWSWPEGRLPTSGELDEAAPGRRVLVSSSDLHRGSVSSAGLEAIGPAEGDLAKVFGEDIARDRRGRPTGELWEAAFGVALQRALADTAAHVQDAGTAAVYAAEAGRYLAHGITHAHDPYLAPDCHVQMAALRAQPDPGRARAYPRRLAHPRTGRRGLGRGDRCAHRTKRTTQPRKNSRTSVTRSPATVRRTSPSAGFTGLSLPGDAARQGRRGAAVDRCAAAAITQ